MVIRQYDTYIVGLDPTLGAEMKKTRPCVVLTPDEMNRHLRTVQIAPLTSTLSKYPWRVPVRLQGRSGMVALDQIRTVDRGRLMKRVNRMPASVVQQIKMVLREMLVD